MRDDAILIVCGGLLQVPAVRIAHELGLKVIVTDANPNAAAMHLADEAVQLDIYDIDGHRRLVDDLAKRYNLRGVFAEGADVEVTVAAAAEQAGLLGIPVEAALNTKNKVRTRRCLDAAGLPNPKWAEISTHDEARTQAARVGYPLIVKAIDNSASRGATRVARPEDLTAAVDLARSASGVGTVLLEELLVGPEQSVEILFDGIGVSHRLNVVDREFAVAGEAAMELGHVNPSTLSDAERDQLFEVAEKAAEAVGVRFGAFKVDTMWTRDGPRILEVTARLSGGFDCQYTTPLSSGRDFIRAAIRVAVGEPIDGKDLRYKWRRYAAAWVAFPPPGRVDRIGNVEAVKAMKGVREVFLRVAVGEVIRPYQDCAARPAFVIAVGDSHDEAISNAKAGAAALAFDTTEV